MKLTGNECRCIAAQVAKQIDIAAIKAEIKQEVLDDLVARLSNPTKPKQVRIGKSLWDTENIGEYHTFDEAQIAAKQVGKRLPTMEEFQQLVDAGETWWDDKLKGRWFADGKLFLPATGYRNATTGQLAYVGSLGNYWSATPHSVTNGRYLYFASGAVNPQSNYYRAYGFAARCVAE